MQSYKSKVKDLYSRIFILGGHWKEFYSWWRESILSGDRNERIMDAGCGSGEVKDLFEKWAIDIDYHGVDLGIGGKDESYKLTTMADLHNLPYKDSSFDKVISISVLEHVDRPHVVMSEFSRILRSKGRAYLHLPFVWHEHQIPQDRFRYPSYGIENLAKDHGFKTIRVLPMGGYFTVLRYMMSNYSFIGEKNSFFIRLFSKLMSPVFNFMDRLLAPFVYLLDKLDKEKKLTLGYFVCLEKVGEIENQSSIIEDPFLCPNCRDESAVLLKGAEQWTCSHCGSVFGKMYDVPKLMKDQKFTPVSDKIKSR